MKKTSTGIVTVIFILAVLLMLFREQIRRANSEDVILPTVKYTMWDLGIKKQLFSIVVPYESEPYVIADGKPSLDSYLENTDVDEMPEEVMFLCDYRNSWQVADEPLHKITRRSSNKIFIVAGMEKGSRGLIEANLSFYYNSPSYGMIEGRDYDDTNRIEVAVERCFDFIKLYPDIGILIKYYPELASETGFFICGVKNLTIPDIIKIIGQLHKRLQIGTICVTFDFDFDTKWDKITSILSRISNSGDIKIKLFPSPITRKK